MPLGRIARRLRAAWRRRVPDALFAATIAAYVPCCALSWSRLAVTKLLGRKPSVVWGPTPILNIRDSSEVLRRLGYDSRTVVFSTYHITRDFDLVLTDWIRGRWQHAVPHAVFLWSLLRFDIFHYYYDYGLWSGFGIAKRAKWLELPLLRLAGKRIVASAYGADVRVRSINEQWPVNACLECPAPGEHCICDAAAAERNVRYYARWANVLLAMGDMHDYVPGSRVDFIYWPIDTAAISPSYPQEHPGPVRLVHAPNHRHFKGTRFIEAAIRELRARGHDVELGLVEGVSNEEARRRCAEADIVVAQCLYGWIGFTEIEGMAYGKPVVTYVRNPELYLGHTGDCPLVSATPDELADALEPLVSDAALRQKVGRESRAYVERVWSYEAALPRYAALHEELWASNRLLGTLRSAARDLFRSTQPHGTTDG